MLTTALAAAVAAAVLAAPATAAWRSATPAVSASWATGSASPATGVTASGGCALLLILQPVVDVSWQASASTGVTGYEIRRSTDGTSYSPVGAVSGRLTTSYRDGTASGLGTKYWYRVRAVHGGWHADSVVATASTPTLCL